MTISWTISTLDREVSTGFVTTAHWQATAVDGEHTASIYSTCSWADGTILIVNPDAYTWYEGNTYRLRADVVASGQITIGYYGYGALATKIAAGAFKNNKA